MGYLSGSIGLDPKTGVFVSEDVREQTRQVLKNLGEILKEAGVSYKNVVKTNVFLKDMNDFTAMNFILNFFQIVIQLDQLFKSLLYHEMLKLKSKVWLF